MPRGLGDLAAYPIGYAAQAAGYFLLLTSRYPRQPERLPRAASLPHPHSVRLVFYDTGQRRSRLLVFFRLMLAFPHIVWLTFWLAPFCSSSQPIIWLIPRSFSAACREQLHRFVAAFVPLPGARRRVRLPRRRTFSRLRRRGRVVSGPDPRHRRARRQRRLVTAFRLKLALPAILVAGAYSGVLLMVGLLGWFAALFTGPDAQRPGPAIGAAAVRYSGQTYAYLFLADPAGTPTRRRRFGPRGPNPPRPKELQR